MDKRRAPLTGVVEKCVDCAAPFMCYSGARRCFICRKKRRKLLRKSERRYKIGMIECGCGTSFSIHSSSNICSKCRKLKQQKLRALDSIGMEIISTKFVSGGLPGLGKRK